MHEPLFSVTEDELQIESITQKVIRRDVGAVVTFTGTVREFTHGRKTLSLRYEAYQTMAVKQLQRIGEEIKEKWPDAITAIWHRTGLLQISDIAVVIAVSTPHRKDAYAANEYAIERIKQIVPIWKKEQWEDGSEWIGNQARNRFRCAKGGKRT
ncbi:molybdenum cofactor biosynthesis protein MoaE [Alkalicoccobacillus plakortidis]|uniref:Molybdenum cofactor biosynthesis protein MoaE n=1 Tax=Alkalicoccobacillus plakortidis TaxID=444060 RepID=A0ABT0XG92_9BACI|nr:molybdenum cofactor biosynthesis protein MoaE [Alkalicoccobacillus plakortidis]MCM2674943.1 molybdenum cofactor biosynthesis protein MoaE [Alkalicoccobacillus plakortidis]